MVVTKTHRSLKFFFHRINAIVKKHLSWPILFRMIFFRFVAILLLLSHLRQQKYRPSFNLCLRKRCDKNEFHFEWPEIFSNWTEIVLHKNAIASRFVVRLVFLFFGVLKEIGQFCSITLFFFSLFYYFQTNFSLFFLSLFQLGLPRCCRHRHYAMCDFCAQPVWH